LTYPGQYRRICLTNLDNFQICSKGFPKNHWTLPRYVRNCQGNMRPHVFARAVFGALRSLFPIPSRYQSLGARTYSGNRFACVVRFRCLRQFCVERDAISQMGANSKQKRHAFSARMDSGTQPSPSSYKSRLPPAQTQTLCSGHDLGLPFWS
jgi:hypothetical protein